MRATDEEARPTGTRDAGWVDRLATHAPLALVGYFALGAALRALTPGGLGLDEAQIMVHAQSLEWGYGPQPPLYAWLQHGAFALLGEGKGALAAVKYGLLAVALSSVWAAARLAGATARTALVAALALLLVPGIAWEAQRALTHTPLALACAALATALFVLVRRRPSPAGHLGLGLMLGAGLLAKWNVVFVAVGLVGAMVLRAPRRPWAALLVVAVALLAVTPTALWYVAAWGQAERAAGTLDVARAAGWGAVPQALGAFAQAVLAMLGLVAVVFALLLARRPAQPAPARVDPALRGDLTTAVAITAAAVLAAVSASGSLEVKERWLTPVLFAVPLVAVFWGETRLTAARVRRLVGAVAVLVLALLAGLQWNWRVGDGEPPPQTAPFAPLASAIRAEGTTVLAYDDWIGGNLRLHAPDLVVLTPGTSALDLPLATPVQLVWPAARGARPPEPLRRLYAVRFGEPPVIAASERLAAPYAPPHGAATPLALGRARVR
jgi:4-amino-4-deoxy-L-arabinose transferase-like glycosyltransferase